MLWFIFYNDEILLERKATGEFLVPESDEAPIRGDFTPFDVTWTDGTLCRGIMLEERYSADGYEMMRLRQSFFSLSQREYLMAGKVSELLYWNRHTRYCGDCGGEMKLHTPISKKCVNCGREVWPQLSTAIIVLVSRGKDEILLVQSNQFRGDYYGLVAGFVETGETLEECVAREVREETQLSVKNIRYFGSQPWPYPCGLMVGFTAEYESGELTLQRSELNKGGWFRRGALPEIPGKMSMARRLIDFWNQSDE